MIICLDNHGLTRYLHFYNHVIHVSQDDVDRFLKEVNWWKEKFDAKEDNLFHSFTNQGQEINEQTKPVSYCGIQSIKSNQYFMPNNGQNNIAAVLIKKIIKRYFSSK